MRRFIWHPLSILIIICRLSAALYMFASPLWGYVWTVFFDYLDSIVYLHILAINRKQYHRIDKTLDLVYFGVMLIIGASYGALTALSILLAYRLIGYLIFMKNGKVTTFIFFPNFFEIVFLWSVFGQITGFTNDMSETHVRTWLLVLFLIKEGHEIILHYFNVLYRRDLERRSHR